MGTARLCYFQPAGCRSVVIEVESDDARGSTDKVMSDALARAVAGLSDEGWEMIGHGAFKYVGVHDEHQDSALYFRRPKK